MRAAEVLRQEEGAGIEKNGWFGGGPWFGGVLSRAELKKSVGASSDFIEK